MEVLKFKKLNVNFESGAHTIILSSGEYILFFFFWFQVGNFILTVLCVLTFRWNFATDEYNIGFGVHFKEDEHAGVKRKAKQMEDVVSLCRRGKRKIVVEEAGVEGKGEGDWEEEERWREIDWLRKRDREEKVEVKVSYWTSVAKQAKTAFLHGPAVWKSRIVGIDHATFRFKSASLTTAPRDPTHIRGIESFKKW